MEEEEVKRLERLIEEDKVGELSKILNSNHNLRNNFNSYRFFNGILTPQYKFIKMPLLHLAVQANSQKVVEYLLSQDFVDKNIENSNGENIYHVICKIKGAELLFSIIESKVTHRLLLCAIWGLRNGSSTLMYAFHIACKLNNVFIVKRVHEILETLQKFDLTSIKKDALYYALENDDIEVIKYVLSIDGIPLNASILYRAIGYSKIEVVVHLFNAYLCQSIPSHFHNQFHIFQFSDNHNNQNNFGTNEYDNYLTVVEENYKNIVKMKYYGKRIWHEYIRNGDLDVVQLIFSLKGIQSEIINDNRDNVFNSFLLSCCFNSNIKVIKYIHKLFPSFINSLRNFNGDQNGAYLLLDNSNLKDGKSDKFHILHYLYLNGIDIHLISNVKNSFCESLYTKINQDKIYDENIVQYLKVISQDFDYLHNEHDDKTYRKPSFWKELQNNNNNNIIDARLNLKFFKRFKLIGETQINNNNKNNNNNNIDEQSMGINVWKNRFDEHVLHHLSKMIQQHMLKPKQT